MGLTLSDLACTVRGRPPASAGVGGRCYSPGREVSGTAFLSAYGGEVELIEIQVTAVTDGPLPDDVTALVSIG